MLHFCISSFVTLHYFLTWISLKKGWIRLKLKSCAFVVLKQSDFAFLSHFLLVQKRTLPCTLLCDARIADRRGPRFLHSLHSSASIATHFRYFEYVSGSEPCSMIKLQLHYLKTLFQCSSMRKKYKSMFVKIP